MTRYREGKRNRIPRHKNCRYCDKFFKKSSPPEVYCSLECRLFDSKNIKENGCWEWKLGKDYDGYGIMSVKNKSQKAHRISYETFIGFFSNELIVCHHCDNPSCINPAHLFLGMHRDNTQDMFLKSRDRVLGEKNVKSILTANNVREIRKYFQDGYKISDISKIFDLSWEHTYAIVKKKLWKHIV